MTGAQKTRTYAKNLDNAQLIDALTYFAGMTSDQGSRTVYSILAAEACGRAGLDPRAVAASDDVVGTISAAL